MTQSSTELTTFQKTFDEVFQRIKSRSLLEESQYKTRKFFTQSIQCETMRQLLSRENQNFSLRLLKQNDFDFLYEKILDMKKTYKTEDGKIAFDPLFLDEDAIYQLFSKRDEQVNNKTGFHFIASNLNAEGFIKLMSFLYLNNHQHPIADICGLTDTDRNTVLHAAAKDHEKLDFLLRHLPPAKKKTLLSKKNIYGFSVVHYTEGNRAALEVLRHHMGDNAFTKALKTPTADNQTMMQIAKVAEDKIYISGFVMPKRSWFSSLFYTAPPKPKVVTEKPSYWGKIMESLFGSKKAASEAVSKQDETLTTPISKESIGFMKTYFESRLWKSDNLKHAPAKKKLLDDLETADNKLLLTKALYAYYDSISVPDLIAYRQSFEECLSTVYYQVEAEEVWSTKVSSSSFSLLEGAPNKTKYQIDYLVKHYTPPTEAAVAKTSRV